MIYLIITTIYIIGFIISSYISYKQNKALRNTIIKNEIDLSEITEHYISKDEEKQKLIKELNKTIKIKDTEKQKLQTQKHNLMNYIESKELEEKLNKDSMVNNYEELVVMIKGNLKEEKKTRWRLLTISEETGINYWTIYKHATQEIGMHYETGQTLKDYYNIK